MADPWHEKFARTLLHYSLGIQPGDKLLIRAMPAAYPLLREVYREAIRAGAHPMIQVELDELDEIKLREGTDEQVGYFPAARLGEIEELDAVLIITASENTRTLSGVPPERVALLQRAGAAWSRRRMERAAAGELRWCGTLFPTRAHAQEAGMSLGEYEDFVYGACLLDRDDPAAAWREVHREQQRIVDYLAGRDEIRIVASETELTYRVGGRTWINSSGARNFPSGEVFTAPHEDSASGTVRFSYPALRFGNEVEDVRLTFREGRVVAATAARGQAFLEAMLELDPGARSLGEVAFGLNYGISRFTRNILFDEKIGGTMHVALGQAYPDSGGTNRSALHWDLICNLHEGRVYADGELCYEDGRFTI